MRKRSLGKTSLLLLPLLMAFAFQATLYARSPVKYGYYAVYTENADISLLLGTDHSPDGGYLLRNSTTQPGLFNLSLGRWGPGYQIYYTDAFHVSNREAFNISLICLNFSDWRDGTEYLSIYLKNDTDGDGDPDGDWVAAWFGAQNRPPQIPVGNQLNSSHHIFFASGGELPVMIEIEVFDQGISIGQGQPEIFYGGTMYLWFTSLTF